MGLRKLTALLGGALKPRIQFPAVNQLRSLHTSRIPKNPVIPKPIPIAPDVPTFLKLIGRDMSEYAEKIPSWEALFTLTSEQLYEIGITKPHARRYLLYWLKRFRDGEFGIGGDFKYIEDGKARLGVYRDLVTDKKFVINLPPGKALADITPEDIHRVAGYKVKRMKQPVGPHARQTKNRMAEVEIVEGLWRIKRGEKVDGGERRQKEIRFKRRVAERRAVREAEGVY